MTYINLGYLVHSQDTFEFLLMTTQDLEVNSIVLESGTWVQNLNFEMTHSKCSVGITCYS